MNPASRSTSNAEITVELTDILTPNVFALMVEKTIEYISYSRSQLPVNFDILRGLMNTRRSRLTKMVASEDSSELYRTLECGGRYKAIEQVFEAYEDTFSNIREALVNGRGVREIAIVIGSPLMPKQIYTLIVPKLTYFHPDPLAHSRRSLCQLFKSLMPALSFPVERSLVETFVYLGLENQAVLPGHWFTPKQFFINPRTPLTVINFDIKAGFVDNIALGLGNFHIHEDAIASFRGDVEMKEDESAQTTRVLQHISQEVSAMPSTSRSPVALRTEYMWCGGKFGLKGFRDEKINGESLLGRLQRVLNNNQEQ